MAHTTTRSVETLLKEFRDDLYYLCHHLTRHAEDAEDLMQEVLVQVHQDLHQFEGRSAILTWICRIAVRRWSRLKRRRQREEEANRLAGAPITVTYPTVGDIDRLAISRALDQLPEDLRLTFVLVKVQGMKYREVAETLDVPLGTVQFRVHDAAQRMMASLARASDEDAARARAWLAERRVRLEAA